MFKERISSFRQNRLSKRSEESNFSEETGYYSSNRNANRGTDVSKSSFVQLYRDFVRKLSRKNDNESVPSNDNRSFGLGAENNRLKTLADYKAYKLILVCVIACFLLFGVLYATGSHEDRKVNSLLRGKSKESVSIDIQLSYEGEVYNLTEAVTVLPEGYSGSEDDDFEIEPETFVEFFSRKLLKQVNRDSEGEYLSLPSNVDGVDIIWSFPKDEVPTWVLGLCLILCIFIYFSRYDEIKKKEKQKRIEFANELPNMTLQYILMLNAGLISDAAFEELIQQKQDAKNYLYEVFRNLLERARTTNSSFVSEMYAFSSSFGNKDFVRFSTLCIEHSRRGSELANKLEQERKLLWDGKLNSAKAKAKEAETKLCFPLMLLLVALVLICVAPAMLGM